MIISELQLFRLKHYMSGTKKRHAIIWHWCILPVPLSSGVRLFQFIQDLFPDKFLGYPNENTEQVKPQSETFNNMFNLNMGYTLIVKGDFTDGQWTGVASRIETPVYNAYTEGGLSDVLLMLNLPFLRQAYKVYQEPAFFSRQYSCL